ncbi:MAG: hypothetical protein IKF31_04280 [Clostridiales bacterium]|nr:hypothetical protein [Clostridiales bacterium]
MKIEAKHNSTKPAYAVGVALLVAAAVFAGCSKKAYDDDNVRVSGELEVTSVETGDDPTTTVTTETSDTSETDYSRETLGDIGENYYKEASADDFVEYDGLRCVKNQLLVSCNIGTSKEQMEEVCEEVGAEIVGYMEITSDFQIEFTEDKTYEELEEIADYLYGYPFVSFISLNMVVDSVPDVVED